jgi:peptidoglycan/xylan/chitin deacetylase (PgdA/CDA1 family)
VSPFLRYVAYPVLHHSGWSRRCFPERSCAVVNYHGVLPDGYASRDSFLDGNLVSKDTLRKQLQLLKRQYHVISPDDFRKWIDGRAEIPARAVLITCDDGLLNTLTDMLPMLEGEGIPCLFFVLGTSCSEEESRLWYEELYLLLACQGNNAKESWGPAGFRAYWWQKVQEGSGLDRCERGEWLNNLQSRCKATPNHAAVKRWKLLNAGELRQISAAGMEIGAHTVSHPVLSACSEEVARREIEESKQAIERALGKPVWAFAYPFGNPETMGEREVQLAREAGFTCAFVNTGGGAVDRSQPFMLSRTHVTAQMNLGEFEAHLSGLHQRLQRAVRG